MAMLGYASGFLQSAVTEAQRCFTAPLDHTRHAVLPELNQPQSRQAVQDKPGSPDPFDSAATRRRDVSTHAASPGAAHQGAGLLTGGLLRPPSRPDQQSTEAPISEVSVRSATTPNGCSTGWPQDGACTQPSSSLSLVVVEKDGTRVSSSLNLPSFAETDDSRSAPPFTMEDTLSSRTSPHALAKEKQMLNNIETKQLGTDMETLRLPDADVRRSWQSGSVLEVFSASLDCWYPALVMHVTKNEKAIDILKVQFWLDIDDAKSKTLSRPDTHLAPLGKNCRGLLPPGFQPRPSKSMPGQTVVLDATTGLKYGNAELAWAAQFQRWLEYRAPAGTQTIRSVAAVSPTVIRVVQTELPTPSKMDTTAAHGLVTQYELSRDHQQSCPVTAASADIGAVHSRTRMEQAPAPIGLVTEYESDWAAVNVKAAQAMVRESPPAPREPMLRSPVNNTGYKDLAMTVPNPGASLPAAARVPQHSAPMAVAAFGATSTQASSNTPIAPQSAAVTSPPQSAAGGYLDARAGMEVVAGRMPMMTTVTGSPMHLEQRPSAQSTLPVGLVTVP